MIRALRLKWRWVNLDQQSGGDDRDGHPIRAGTVWMKQGVAKLPTVITAIYEDLVGRRGTPLDLAQVLLEGLTATERRRRLRMRQLQLEAIGDSFVRPSVR